MNIKDSFDTRIAMASSDTKDTKDAKDAKDVKDAKNTKDAKDAKDAKNTKDIMDKNISIKESFALLCRMIHGEDSMYMKNILIDIDEPNIKIQLIKIYIYNFRINPVLSLIYVSFEQ